MQSSIEKEKIKAEIVRSRQQFEDTRLRIEGMYLRAVDASSLDDINNSPAVILAMRISRLGNECFWRRRYTEGSDRLAMAVSHFTLDNFGTNMGSENLELAVRANVARELANRMRRKS